MSSHKRIDLICVIVMIFALILTVLFMNGEALGITLVVDEDSEAGSDAKYFTNADLNGTWDRENANTIVLSDSGSTFTGKGTYQYQNTVVIASDGYYEVTGTLSDGALVVDAENTAKVHILLNGVSITCSDNAAFRVANADKVFLTLAENTENTFVSGDTYSSAAISDGADGAIFSHDDLTINGSGALSVSASYKHGISANDDLVITGGTITVNASAGDGIRANDSIRVTSANLTVNASDEGISVAGENGYLYIESGTFAITAGDDGVNAVGAITVSGGTFTITAGDDGIHSDTDLLWENGTLLIENCYEGLEGVTVTISGGDLTIYCSDDGINASDGSGSSAPGGTGGVGNGGAPGNAPASAGSTGDFETSTAETSANGIYVLISGGTTRIYNPTGQDADCIDSNGDIFITGGKVLVSAANNAGNNAFDYASESGGVCEISGGTVVGCCNGSMAENFTSGSAQASVLLGVEATGDQSTLRIADAQGNTLLEETIPYGFSSAIVSIPEFTLGESYTVTIGQTEYEITLSDTLNTVGSAASGSAFGGMGDQGMGASPGDMGEQSGMGGDPPGGRNEPSA